MARVDRDRRYISWGGMALGVVMLLSLFFAALIWVREDIDRLQIEDTTLQLRVNVMEMDYASLQLELARVGSEGYVETAAREYGFIKSDEILFAFADPDLLKGYTAEDYQVILEEMRD